METISTKQGISLVITFILCNSYSLLFGADCGKDVWLAYIFASVLAALIWWLLSAVLDKHDFNSFFEMMDFAFGRVTGKVLSAILLLYALLSCTTSMALFGRFTQLTALTKTPQIVLPLAILVLAAWGLKSGLRILSQGNTLLFYFALFTFVCFIFFGLPQLDVKNITPILENGILPTAKSALTVFTNQFGDALLLFCIYPHIRKSAKRRKAMLIALISATAMVSVIAAFTVLTLGGVQVANEFFPVFTILSIRNVGAYIQHMEILTSVAMTFFIFVRQTVSLYFAATAIAHIFKTRSFSAYLLPLALIISSGTQLLYWNMMSLRSRIEGNLNLYILLPLQLLLPCIMGVILTIKRKKEK